jgi:NAD(P)-dependent dehydrogenase (short-subunit alcohol dehydrogenase family)
MSNHLLLFGASGGIASALSQRLHAQGWHLTLATRNPDAVQQEGAHVVQADATTESGARTAFDAAEEAFGTPTAVVNCLGNVLLKPLHQTTAVEFSDLMRLHAFSSYVIARESAKRMKQGGSVVLVSSVAASTGLPNHELIAMAKGAVEGLVRSAAATYASKGLRFNAVAPGLTETPATAALCKEPARKISEKMHPLGRIGTPQDIASAIAWLVDPENTWISGEILHVDGGMAHLRGRPA